MRHHLERVAEALRAAETGRFVAFDRMPVGAVEKWLPLAKAAVDALELSTERGGLIYNAGETRLVGPWIKEESA